MIARSRKAGSRNRSPGSTAQAGIRSSPDAALVEQLRTGDPEAGHRFFRECYPSVYRYLLWLTGRPDQAEDLAQDTFVRAWQSLDRFDDRWPLRPWLHRIAYREFLHALRRRRDEASLEDVAEVSAPEVTPWTEAVELREIVRQLPVQEASVVALHYLEGYSSAEIARIVGLPAGTVRHRLSEARARLQRELGEDDLAYLNEPSVPMRQWGWLPLDQMHALETRLGTGRSSVFGVRSSERSVSNTEHRTPNTGSEATEEESMERREFLRQAAVGAAGLVLTEPEKEIVDNRLTQKVTCAFKATALSDLCEKLKTGTGIRLAAGPSVADEKVTLFCEKLPLREVMRQLSRPFGYTWLRSGQALGVGRQALGESAVGPNAQRPTPNASFRYELVQDLRSQLLEEELRNRDRNAALVALDQEMERYRPFLSLSPDEALAQSRTASPAEKLLLENLAREGWGPIQMYFRLAPGDLAALRAGQTLLFKQEPGQGEQPLPPDIARGTLESQRVRRLRDDPDNPDWPRFGNAESLPDGLPPASYPGARAWVELRLGHTELGRYTLQGISTVQAGKEKGNGDRELASGMSPAVSDPENARLTSRWAQDPALRAHVKIAPEPSCLGAPPPDPAAMPGEAQPARATSADVLEALHRASGLPVVGDFYTRLYPAAQVSLQNATLFDALNRLSDRMRLRWHWDKTSGNWLQFRSVSYYDDRLKEVPNRLLSRWAAARREHGYLPLDDLVEIAQLSNVQLNSDTMAEGARVCFGLPEWDLVRWWDARFHLRFLANFTSDQRRTAMSAAGLPFRQLSLAQQQRLVAHLTTVAGEQLPPLEAISQTTIHVVYLQPGEFEWVQPGMSEYLGPGRPWPANFFQLPTARGRTRDAVLQAARRVDPNVEPAQIRPTELWLAVILRIVDPRTGQVSEWGFSGKANDGRGWGSWPYY